MKKWSFTTVLSVAFLFLGYSSDVKQVDTSLERASALMKESSAEFKSAWDSGDVEGLTTIFTEDGIRVLGGSQEAIIGSDAIYQSFDLAHAEGSGFNGSHIEITIADARFLSDEIMIGSGTFNISNGANESLEYGTWGNVYKVVDNKARMLMESAYNQSFDAVVSNGEVLRAEFSWQVLYRLQKNILPKYKNFLDNMRIFGMIKIMMV
ncbi:MAG: hypothetical protein ACI8R9_002610 [Paraglaciecola sp.]|jgi:hypothetical protein